jgi:hypothetical protein
MIAVLQSSVRVDEIEALPLDTFEKHRSRGSVNEIPTHVGKDLS